MTHHEMVEESIFPLVFTVHIEQLYLVQGENKVTGATESFQKGACQGACL